MDIKEIIKLRNSYPYKSPEWQQYNALKEGILREKYGDEKIAVVDSIILSNMLEGVIKIIPGIEKYYFIERYKAEYNPTIKQLIPYCLIRYKDKYFILQRKEGVGEDRLTNKYALVGGHWNEIDKRVEDCLMRELKEEVGIGKNEIEEIEFKGYIYTNANDVSADHLGLFYIIKVNTSKIQTQEKELEGAWMNKYELREIADEMEVWLKILYEGGYLFE